MSGEGAEIGRSKIEADEGNGEREIAIVEGEETS